MAEALQSTSKITGFVPPPQLALPPPLPLPFPLLKPKSSIFDPKLLRPAILDAHAGQPAMSIRKGAAQAVQKHVESRGGIFPLGVTKIVEEVSRRGATPLVVAEGAQTLGVIELKDVVKGGIKERFAQLRKMGIRTIMITGDNALTAAAIAAGRVLTHRQILREVWEPKSEEHRQYLRVYVTHLRQKIDPAAPAPIRTEPGIGYRFTQS